MSLPERFWNKVELPANGSSCWRWLGTKSRGYAFYYPGSGSYRGTRSAHRTAYRMLRGPIPSNLVIDHLCRNKLCVNPWHMEIVSHAENTRRGLSPSAINAKKTHCIYGHPLSGENLYVWAGGARHCRACGRRRANARYVARRS